VRCKEKANGFHNILLVQDGMGIAAPVLHRFDLLFGTGNWGL
jgi:hypothetical protein